MSIRVKLYFSCLISIICFMVLMFSSMYFESRFEKLESEIAKKSQELLEISVLRSTTKTLKTLSSIISTHPPDGVVPDEAKKQFIDVIRYYKDRESFISSLNFKLNDNSLAYTIRRDSGQLFNLIGSQLFTAIEQRASKEVFIQLNDEVTKVTDKIDNDLFAYSNKLSADIKQTNDALKENSEFSFNVKVLNMFIFLLIIVPLTTRMVKEVPFALLRLANTLKKIEKGDAQHKIPYTNLTNEIGVLANAVDSLRNANIKTTESVEQQEKQVLKKEHRNQRLENFIDDFEKKSGEIITAVSNSSNRLYQLAESLSSKMQGIVGKTVNFTQRSEQAVSNLNLLKTSSEAVSRTASRISEKSAHSDNAALSISQKAIEAGISINELTDISHSIYASANLIEGINSQINLLSINAAIESARGGNDLKNISSLSSEIKTISETTDKIYSEISDKITRLQLLSTELNVAINIIKAAANYIIEQKNSASANYNETANSITEIASGITTAVNSLSEINGSISSVSEFSASSRTSVLQMLDSARILSNQSKSLNKELLNFLNDLRKA